MWFRNDCERQGADDYDRYRRPDYERSRYDFDDKCYFSGYDAAEREHDRRRDEKREQEAAEERASERRRADARAEDEQALEEQQRQEFYAMQDEWAEQHEPIAEVGPDGATGREGE